MGGPIGPRITEKIAAFKEGVSQEKTGPTIPLIFAQEINFMPGKMRGPSGPGPELGPRGHKETVRRFGEEEEMIFEFNYGPLKWFHIKTGTDIVDIPPRDEIDIAVLVMVRGKEIVKSLHSCGIRIVP